MQVSLELLDKLKNVSENDIEMVMKALEGYQPNDAHQDIEQFIFQYASFGLYLLSDLIKIPFELKRYEAQRVLITDRIQEYNLEIKLLECLRGAYDDREKDLEAFANGSERGIFLP